MTIAKTYTFTTETEAVRFLKKYSKIGWWVCQPQHTDAGWQIIRYITY